MRLYTSILCLAAACTTNASSSTGDTDTAASVVDSSSSVQSESDLMMTLLDGADATSLTAPTAGQIAARIAANIEARWSPAGCAVANVSATSISVTYADCSGPQGLLDVTGTLQLGVSLAPADYGVQVTANLTVNGAALSFMATATLAPSATGYALTVQTTGTGTIGGISVDHDGSYTLGWEKGSQCRDLSATFSTDIAAGSATAAGSTDAEIKRCGVACPTGTITRDDPRSTLDITLDGSSTATWTRSTGGSGTVEMPCE